MSNRVSEIANWVPDTDARVNHSTHLRTVDLSTGSQQVFSRAVMTPLCVVMLPSVDVFKCCVVVVKPVMSHRTFKLISTTGEDVLKLPLHLISESSHRNKPITLLCGLKVRYKVKHK